MGTTSARLIPSGALITGVVDLADSGNVVAATSGKKILVWDIILTNSDSTKTVIFKSATTALTGDMTFSNLFLSRLQGAVQGFSSGVPLFETASGEAFVATLSAAAAISGQVIYSLE